MSENQPTDSVTARVSVDRIVAGERDRTDLGDITELADSIAAVGLLHPIVVTADMTLVAGDRRLAAVRHLGWAEAPVTVVDLATAADVLRAESDENTCRKPLTPYEASRARERRARVLAPKIQENRGGRPALAPTPQGGLWSAAPPKETSANLAEVSPPTSSRETRKVGAIGTGYSGSTLDKVDKIRAIAERGVIRQGRSETPAPAPVVEIAKHALEDVKVSGAAVDRATRQVEQAVEDYVEAGTDVQREKLRKAVYRAMEQTDGGLPKLSADRVAEVLDEELWEALSDTRQRITGWIEQVERLKNRRGLRVVGGDK